MAKIDLMVRYAGIVDTKLRKTLVLKDGIIFNNKYEGSPKAGAVKIRKTGEANVGDYDLENGASLDRHNSQWINIPINKDIYVNELIDGYEASAVPDGMIADRLDAAGAGIADKLDKDGAVELVTGGTQIESTNALTKSTAYDTIVDVRKAMTIAGVPNDGRRFLIVSPDVYAILLKDNDHFIRSTDFGDGVVASGYVGRIAGFNVYESANLGEDIEFVAGHPEFCTRVKEFSILPKVTDLAQSGKFIGACAVQARMVYAHKVTNADAIFVKATKTINP